MDDRSTTELAIIVYLDIAGYSLLGIEEQVRTSAELRRIVRDALDGTDMPGVGHLTIDSGDGVAIVFFGGGSRAIDCAERVAGDLRDLGVPVRTGLHCGPVARTVDVAGQQTVSGPGINLAQRVMAFADPGQILLSDAAAEIAAAHEKWRPHLCDFGEHDAKHGVPIRVFGLGDPLRGNPEMPVRLQKGQRSNRHRQTHFFAEPDRPFIGRRLERERLQQTLESPGRRLITLTGPGGIGKTRLAIATALELAPNYADGIWFVDCDTLSNSEDLVAKLASAPYFDVPNARLEDLAEALADRNLLIVADCFERILRSAHVLEEILRRAPEVQIIVTSRILLGLSRESEFPLGPLSTLREAGAMADAMALFVSAAQSAQPSFRLTRQNRDAVESIVSTVEAVPLALILAAGRLRHLSLDELLVQLQRRPLEILKRKTTGNDRHANLERVVEDSFNLLDPVGRELLVSLSVFRGGFGLMDAEAVLGEGATVLEGISDLRDNSLLTAHTSDGVTRYRALDVVAEYLENLDATPRTHSLRQSHSHYFAQRARQLRELYETGNWREASLSLGAELGNYRRAVEFAVEIGDRELIRDFGRSLSRLFMEAGYRADFDKLSSAAEPAAETAEDLELLVELCGLQGGVCRRDHDLAGAKRFWRRRAEYCRQVHDFNREADSWLDLADLAVVLGEPEEAQEPLEKFKEIESKIQDELILASGNAARSKYAVQLGHMEEAAMLADRARAAAERLPHRMHSFYVWMSLAEIYFELGRADLSMSICKASLRETVLGRHYSYTGLLLCRLTPVLAKEGHIELAAECLVIASAIPKAVSQVLREQVKTQKDAFVRMHGSKALSEAEGRVGGLAWTSSALAMADQLDNLS